MNAPPRYDQFSDAEMSRHFMPRQAVPDHEVWLARDLELSEALKARLQPRRDQRYGPGPRQVADLYAAARPDAPLLVYFHGGYWRGLSKDHVGYVAGPLADANVATVIPNYDLCPDITLDALVEQARQAVAFALTMARSLNASAGRLFLAGNSAGAHLAAMMLAAGAGSFSAPIAGLFLVTGIYDLRPILRVQVNDDTRLSLQEAERLSPLLLPLSAGARAHISVGALEPALWIEQSRRLSAKFSALGHQSDLMIAPGLHHFSITQSLSDPGSPLARALIEFVH